MQSQFRSTSSRAFAETDRWRVIRTATCPRGQDPCSFPDCVSPDFVCRRCGNTLSAATAPSSLRPGTPSRRSQALEHDEPRTHIRSIQTNRDFQRSIWAARLSGRVCAGPLGARAPHCLCGTRARYNSACCMRHPTTHGDSAAKLSISRFRDAHCGLGNVALRCAALQTCSATLGCAGQHNTHTGASVCNIGSCFSRSHYLEAS